MNKHQLKWLARRLPKRNNKWFSALEQSGLSACNFLYSLLIVNVAGVANLGVYSYWFVACQFMVMLTTGLATRQMVLQFSSDTFSEQCHGFSRSRLVVAGLQIIQALLLALLVLAHPPVEGVMSLWLALVFYSASTNFAELYRQYYYLRSRNRQSLWFSGLSLSTSTAGFGLLIVSGVSQSPELHAFWFLAIGNIGFIVLAHQALKGRRLYAGVVFSDVVALCRTFWKPGIPSTGGMLVTWLQNQSVTPLLMFMFGPLYVGYYSLARMIVTPVNMVTTGLAKSALPNVRRAFGNGDIDALTASVQDHRRTTMRIVYGYVGLVAVIWLVGRAFGFFEVSAILIAMFIATVLVMILSNYRYWISQKFVVQMQFGILLTLGVIASSLTVAMMLGGGIVLKTATWVVFAPAVGELFLIYFLNRRLSQMQKMNV